MYSLDWCKYVNHSSLGLRTTGTFQAYTVEISHGGLDVRAMLTAYELALLHAVAREWYTRAVEILDGGPLLGPSTYAVARGLAANEGLSLKAASNFLF